jgi:hypothetical protein
LCYPYSLISFEHLVHFHLYHFPFQLFSTKQTYIFCLLSLTLDIFKYHFFNFPDETQGKHNSLGILVDWIFQNRGKADNRERANADDQQYAKVLEDWVLSSELVFCFWLYFSWYVNAKMLLSWQRFPLCIPFSLWRFNSGFKRGYLVCPTIFQHIYLKRKFDLLPFFYVSGESFWSIMHITLHKKILSECHTLLVSMLTLLLPRACSIYRKMFTKTPSRY